MSGLCSLPGFGVLTPYPCRHGLIIVVLAGLEVVSILTMSLSEGMGAWMWNLFTVMVMDQFSVEERRVMELVVMGILPSEEHGSLKIVNRGLERWLGD